jgi:hypothetical protein
MSGRVFDISCWAVRIGKRQKPQIWQEDYPSGLERDYEVNLPMAVIFGTSAKP